MNIKVDFDNIVVKEDKNDFNVKVLMLKGEKGDQGDGENNVIEVVQVNGTSLPVTNKTVNVPVPVVDSSISSSSTNPVQNKVIYEALGNKVDTSELDNYYEISQVDAFVSEINKKTYYFDSVQGMKSYNLQEGDYVITKGYYTANDGGGALYNIVSTSSGYYETLDNNLLAELTAYERVNVKQLGAKGDNSNDDTIAIQTSIDKFGYAYLPVGNYKITTSIELNSQQSIYGDNFEDTIITYTGSSNCIKNKDVSTCVEVSIHDITLIGNNKAGNGIYLYRTSKSGDAYHNLYNLKISYFENGIYAGQYQNETKFNNLYISHCITGINFYYLNDCYVNNVVTCNNDKDGILILGSSEIRLVNIKSWYNGSTDVNDTYNINIKASASLMLNNIGCQESYGANMNISSSNNINATNLYLSWPGLGNPTNIYQLILDNSNNCKIDGTTQNGKYNVSGYSNYILALKSHPYNCEVNLKGENDFPVAQKIYLIGNNSNYNGVFNRNDFNILINTLRYNKSNFAKNGNLANTTTLSFVNSNSHCSWNSGLLRVDTTGETSNTNIYFQNITLPRADFYVSYMKFKKVSGSGNVIFESPGYASINSDDEVGKEYYISMAKYTNTSKQFITLTIAPNIVIDISEFGIVLGESAAFDTPMNIKAVI